jgi:hypothetical protein
MLNRETQLLFFIAAIVLVAFLAGIDFIFDHFLHVIIFVFGSVLPDIIEPAHNYKHHNIFYGRLSMKIMSLAFVASFLLGISNQSFPLLSALSAGCILHLAVESTSEMGLTQSI